jgi:methylmalonyl-CoA mutase cobalamin-binding subunit
MQNGQSCRVALVGRQLEDNENLGLGYLQTALANAGVAADRYVLNDVTNIEQVAGALMQQRYELVGLSLSDGGSALNMLAFGEMLRRRGYGGTIVAGGPFATLARDWLLQRYAWLHAVVRHAGEVPLVALVRALQEGRDLREVAGLSTRDGDGAPAPVTAALPLQLTPQHVELPSLLGQRMAHIQGTRGCQGRCGYCGPAALQELEQTDARRSGINHKDLHRLGIGGVRRRSTDSLCDEIAALYQRDVRYFYLVDEHCLPYREADAHAFLANLGAGLAKRRVGPRGFGCMLRPERLTSALLDSFVDVGLVRAFLGLEFATAEQGRLFHRRVDPGHGRELLTHMDAKNVACIANLMLVHTESTRQSIEAGIDFLASAEAGIVETTRMMVYHGTRLQLEMQRAGRLTGNPLRYGYHLGDPVAERFSQVFARLRLQAFGDHSLSQRVHEVATTLSLGLRLFPNATLRAAQSECRLLEAGVRELTHTSLRRAFELVEPSMPSELTLTDWLADVAQRASALRRRADRLEREIAAAVHQLPSHFSPMRAAAARTLTFTMLGTAAACGGSTDDGKYPASNAGASAMGGGTASSGASAMGGAANGGASSAGTGGRWYLQQCSADVTAALTGQIQARVAASQVPCFGGTISQAGTTLGWRVSDATCNQTRSIYASQALAAVSDIAPPDCAVSVLITGGEQTDINSLRQAISLAGCDVTCTNYVVQIDASGKFVDVTGNASAQVLDCIRTALSGLTFPCLTGGQVCPEPCIVE